jgi:hypothetical protein
MPWKFQGEKEKSEGEKEDGQQKKEGEEEKGRENEGNCPLEDMKNLQEHRVFSKSNLGKAKWF